MANIDADLSSEALSRTGLLKKVTYPEEITGEFKFKAAFSFKNYAKLIFSANMRAEGFHDNRPRINGGVKTLRLEIYRIKKLRASG